MKGALDEVIAVLKSDSTSKKAEIESLVDRLSEADFNALTVLAQLLVDYEPISETHN